MFQIEKKLCLGAKNVLLWYIMVLNCQDCLLWSYAALYGLMQPYLILWSCLTFLRLYVAFSYGRLSKFLWSCFIRRRSSFQDLFMTFFLDFGSTATDRRLLVIQGNWPSSYKTKGFSLGLILFSKSCLYQLKAILDLKMLTIYYCNQYRNKQNSAKFTGSVWVIPFKESYLQLTPYSKSLMLCKKV